MKNKRFLGQHFLNSEKIKYKILGTIEKYEMLCNSILEIGPGKGAITEKLINLNKPVFAVEKDNNLSLLLKKKYSKLTLFECDARSFEISKIESNNLPVLVIGNLPYYAAKDIILNLLSNPSKISSAHFTLQKEVALKFSSSVGEKYYSKYSIWANTFYNTIIEFEIKRGAFSPPPKVLSSFMTFVPKIHPALIETESLKFFSFLEKVFWHKRKKFISNLQNLGIKGDEDFLSTISKDLRPTEITPQYFISAYKSISNF